MFGCNVLIRRPPRSPLFPYRAVCRSWQAASAGLSNTTIWTLMFDGKALYAGTDGGGVFVSRDGGTSWQAASAGLSKATHSTQLFERQSFVYGTVVGSVVVSRDGGTSW